MRGKGRGGGGEAVREGRREVVMEEREGGGQGVRVTCDHPRRHRQARRVTLGSAGLLGGGRGGGR